MYFSVQLAPCADLCVLNMTLFVTLRSITCCGLWSTYGVHRYIGRQTVLCTYVQGQGQKVAGRSRFFPEWDYVVLQCCERRLLQIDVLCTCSMYYVRTYVVHVVYTSTYSVVGSKA